MAFIGGILSVGQYLWGPLKRQISYIKNVEKNFEKLEGEVIDLQNKREDVNTEINRDTITKMPTAECRTWLGRVEGMEEKVKAMQTEFKENKRCIGRLCPNIWWRKNLGEKVVTVIGEIQTLKEDSMLSRAYVVESSLQTVKPIPTPTIEGDSAINRMVQKIFRCIEDGDKQKIGIWGMGGVGKTTTMTALNNLPQIKGLFDVVIWVTVSKEGGIRTVQKGILERQPLKFDENDSIDATVNKIFEQLSNKKYLLLLDDLWGAMELEKIGIPNPSKENGCKIIITTRSMDVCNKMGTDEAIRVETLSEAEAWDLFRQKVGDALNSEDIRKIATEVVEECKGLPLAIKVIGGSLRNKKKPGEWRNALKELKSNKYRMIDDMEGEVLQRLKYSYDQLKSDDIKKCFLYCALYPEDYEIREEFVIERWRAEGFIDDALSLNEAYDAGVSIIAYLKDVSLLEGVDDDRMSWIGPRVKMHDVIRDLALKITSPPSSSTSLSDKMVREDGNQFLVRTNIGEEELSNEEDWGQFQRISFMWSRFHNLPESPASSLLVTLFLQGNVELTRIPESFFERMHNLRVLDLSDTAIKELPSSVSNLVSLRGLYLADCYGLVTLPSQIGNLRKLQVLQIGNSFEYLPIEIQQLTLLRSLEVTFRKTRSESRVMIPNGIISRLSQLEYLNIQVRDSSNFGECVAEEVVRLKKLTQLVFSFPTLESFDKFVRESSPLKNGSLKSYRLIVHCDSEGRYRFLPHYFLSRTSDDRILQVSHGNYTPSGSVFAEVLHRFNIFQLEDHETCRGLLDFGLKKLNHLERCSVERCSMMETVINGNELTTTSSVLPNLEYLSVNVMRTLRAVWEGPMPPGSFSRLASLSISRCGNLRWIFTRGMLLRLPNIERLDVRDCDAVQVIVNEEEEEIGCHDDDDDVALFPKLNSLALWHLPGLKRIWKTVSFPMAPSLEEIRVIRCPKLESLLPLISLGIE